ncbi:MAG TPA: ATP synthase F1 subunit delta [Elusimicrobia bacterium]|nr:ATP synthase F1 subunit delta [Elusimicrobiota bacterium]HBT61169.1 ATP synthase F1 subunit delta [Elusimicrobiota bacterium]
MQTSDRTLASRYARALFACACDQGEEESVARDLKACARVLAAAGSLLRDPRVSTAEKKNLVMQIVGRQARPLTVDFLDLLIEEKRFNLVLLVAQDVEKLLAQKRQRARAKVRAARPLSDDDRRRLRERLERFAGCGVELEVEEDPDLLGGVSVRLGDWVLDGSLRGQLEGIKEAIGGD